MDDAASDATPVDGSGCAGTATRFAIGVPTFNRRHLVAMAAAALRGCRGIEACDLLVVDDASTDYDEAYLRAVFPAHAQIVRRECNSGGADWAAYDMLSRLQATTADFLVLIDSDMVVASDLFDRLPAVLMQSDGLISLFNTPSHPTQEIRGALAIKRSVGATATVWRRHLALEVLKAVPAGPSWDWRFCSHLHAQGVEICAARASLAQHIGFMHGQNSSQETGDIGVDFSDPDPKNAYRILEALMFSTMSYQVNNLAAGDILEKRLRRMEKWTGLGPLYRLKNRLNQRIS